MIHRQADRADWAEFRVSRRVWAYLGLFMAAGRSQFFTGAWHMRPRIARGERADKRQ